MPDAANVVEKEILIAATPETVFPFLIEADRLTRWSGTAATLDPQPGGIYRVVMGDDVARGEFVEIDPPRRVVYTWGWEGSDEMPPGCSTVEVTLTAQGDRTLLRLVHRDFPDGLAESHSEGWDYYIPRLGIAAAGGDPGPDTHAGA